MEATVTNALGSPKLPKKVKKKKSKTRHLRKTNMSLRCSQSAMKTLGKQFKML